MCAHTFYDVVDQSLQTTLTFAGWQCEDAAQPLRNQTHFAILPVLPDPMWHIEQASLVKSNMKLNEFSFSAILNEYRLHLPGRRVWMGPTDSSCGTPSPDCRCPDHSAPLLCQSICHVVQVMWMYTWSSNMYLSHVRAPHRHWCTILDRLKLENVSHLFSVHFSTFQTHRLNYSPSQ